MSSPLSAPPKDLTGEMAAGYSPAEIESDWYAWWEQQGLFKPRAPDSSEKFVIVLPPPNVTGSLHLGHTLTCAVQDALIRWHRMLGHDTLWVPGTDHAGIATQVVVEKKIAKDEGITRHDLGREKFLQRVFQWKDDHAGKITNQLRRIAASLDWSREAFTMDAPRSKSVTEAFVRLFDAGLIYRSTRLVNWCPALKTALSDMEVEYVDISAHEKIRVPGYLKPVEFGTLTHFAYKIHGGEAGEEIVVATTRPETILGDTAVAVHPTDERYKKYHGRHVIHPFSDRLIPIVCDAVLVDPTFGTGAVKVTPAHDPNDFQCGKRNGLPEINVYTDDGIINANGGEYAGKKRFEARDLIVKALEAKGLLRGVAGHAMRLGLCSRTGDVIEPLIKEQWYVKCDEMAAKACEKVRNGELTILPKEHEAVWFRWLENIRDWCISRQLWWGHRIPAYKIVLSDGTEKWEAAHSEEEAIKKAGVKKEDVTSVHQDEDVLDTWFSSGLFPFSVFEWPNETLDMQRFFPTTLLETGSDILFFWVARMVMMSLALCDTLPFKTVFLHSMVRDKFGRKMSKSLGNVIDPIDVIHGITLDELGDKLALGNLDPREVEKAKKGQKEQFPSGIPECGADALRFALLAYMSQTRDINLDISRVQGYRQFCNKLFNVLKFSLTNLKDFAPNTSTPSLIDSWMLSRLSNMVEKVNSSMQAYEFAEATTALYNFWLYELCDVYLEAIKPAMRLPEGDEKRKAAQQTLWTCMEVGFRAMHPFMPFLTEELWQRLPCIAKVKEEHNVCSIMIAPFPTTAQFASLRNTEVETLVAHALDIVHACRSVRAQYNLTTQRPASFVRTVVDIATVKDVIATLGQVGTVEVIGEEAREFCVVQVVDDKTEVLVEMKGMVDVDAEMKKLNKKVETVNKNMDTMKKKMTMPGYETKVPEAVRQQNNEQVVKLEEEERALRRAMEDMLKLK